MEVKYYSTPQEMLANCGKILMQAEAINQLLISILNRLTVFEHQQAGSLMVDNQIVMVFYNAPPRNLLVYPLRNITSDEFEWLLDQLKGEQSLTQVFFGINGNHELCELFNNYLQQQGITTMLHLAMDIMVLDQLLPYHAVEGRLRKGTIDDQKTLAKFIQGFSYEALLETVPDDKALEDAVYKLTNSRIYFFEDPTGRAVSCTHITRQLSKGAGLSLVYSDHDVRGRHYGYAVVYLVCQQLFEEGNAYCTLYVDKKNPISNRVYEKIGFKIVEAQYDYRINH